MKGCGRLSNPSPIHTVFVYTIHVYGADASSIERSTLVILNAYYDTCSSFDLPTQVTISQLRVMKSIEFNWSAWCTYLALGELYPFETRVYQLLSVGVELTSQQIQWPSL